MKADQEFVSDEDEDAELDESLQQLDDKESEDLATDQIVAEEEPLAEARYLEVVDALRAMLDGERVDLGKLGELSDEERAALEFLERVLSGRDLGGDFMYAEERLEGLNQVLAQLQPLLSVGGVHNVLNDSLNQIVDSFSDLRDQLRGLEEAQEEVFHEPEKKKPEGDDDGDEDDKGEPEGEGEEEVEKPPAKSTVWDPDDRGDGPA